MALQYFHFDTPQPILIHKSATRVALGYWLDTDDPKNQARFNMAEGKLNHSDTDVYINWDCIGAEF